MTLKVDIKKKFKDFKLDISFEGDQGWHGLLGVSGCGKSMTLKTIAGVATPDEGTIELNGKTLFDSKRKINLAPQERNIGFLFQHYALFPNMTAEENIRIGLSRNPNAKEKIVKETIERFHLKGAEKKYPGQLSGGQQQRVALARSLVYEPDLILLDEPFSALDEYLKENIQRETKEILREYNKEVLLVTHSREEIFRFCGRVTILDRGKVVTTGDTADIFESPKTFITAKLSGCKNISRARKIGNKKVSADDWGMVLHTETHITEEIEYVGVRAHDITQVTEAIEKGSVSERSKNHFNLKVIEVEEGLFERNVIMRAVEDNGRWLMLKQTKGDWRELKELREKITIEIPKEKILLLEK